MNNEMKNFLKDLISILQEKYNDSLTKDGVSDDKKEFSQGLNFAYYDTLDIIESQLKLFGYDIDDLGIITPDLGKKIDS